MGRFKARFKGRSAFFAAILGACDAAEIGLLRVAQCP
jgi:hypothetical protein